MLKDIFLAGAARTAIGGFGGVFAEVPGHEACWAVRLSVPPCSGRECRAIRATRCDLWQCPQCRLLGQNPARQASLGAGLSTSIGATTVAKVCGSGLKAVMLAAQAIQCGDASVVVAGGMENMSRAPYLLDKARTGYRMGNGELIDSMIKDGLWDVYNNLHMGTCGDRCAAKYNFTRQQQDDFAVASYQRARAAVADGTFAREIVPVDAPAGKATVPVVADETARASTRKSCAGLRPAFGKEGTDQCRQRFQHQRRALPRWWCCRRSEVKSLGVKAAARGYWVTRRRRASRSGSPSRRSSHIQAARQAPSSSRRRRSFRNQRGLRRGDDGGDEGSEHSPRKSERIRRRRRPGSSHRRQRPPDAGDFADTRCGAATWPRIGIDSLCIGGGEAVAMAVESCAEWSCAWIVA